MIDPCFWILACAHTQPHCLDSYDVTSVTLHPSHLISHLPWAQLSHLPLLPPLLLPSINQDI